MSYLMFVYRSALTRNNSSVCLAYKLSSSMVHMNLAISLQTKSNFCMFHYFSVCKELLSTNKTCLIFIVFPCDVDTKTRQNHGIKCISSRYRKIGVRIVIKPVGGLLWTAVSCSLLVRQRTSESSIRNNFEILTVTRYKCVYVYLVTSTISARSRHIEQYN